MENPFLHNDALIKFIKWLGISADNKESLIAKVPQLNDFERQDLFEVLKEVFYLDMEEKEAVARLRKYWKS